MGEGVCRRVISDYRAFVTHMSMITCGLFEKEGCGNSFELWEMPDADMRRSARGWSADVMGMRVRICPRNSRCEARPGVNMRVRRVSHEVLQERA
jgi:hypothetical protein